MSNTQEIELAGAPGAVVGGQIMRYRLLRRIGRGGMAEVWDAVRVDIGLRVALKLLDPNLARDSRMRKRFFQEAQHLSKLVHPGLVKVIDYSADSESTTFVAMELLTGQSLRERLDQEPQLPYPTVLRLMMQLASALAAAHQCQIVHRDLKPENLMLVADSAVIGQERLKVVDFGIARSFAIGSGAAYDSMLVGTPPYMSPEQFRGGAIFPSTDVYSMGIVLYEALTGGLPFRGTIDEIRQQHLSGPRPQLNQLCPELPPQLDELLLAMLSKRPEQRPTMERVESALQALLTEPPSARSMPRGERPVDKSRLAMPVVSAALMLSLMAAVGWALNLWPPSKPMPKPIPGMIQLPPGIYTMGITPEEVERAFQQCMQEKRTDCRREIFEREQPQRKVKMSSFQVDSALVSNEQMVHYLNDLGAMLRIKPDSETKVLRYVYSDDVLLFDLYEARSGIVYRDGKFHSKPQHENLPAQQVTWNGALRFCLHEGKQLLTEAQWEYLNTLGRDKKISTAFRVTPGLGEWVADRHSRQYLPCAGTCQDPVNGASETDRQGYRVVRGCASGESQVHCRPTARGFQAANAASVEVGFRCAAP